MIVEIHSKKALKEFIEAGGSLKNAYVISFHDPIMYAIRYDKMYSPIDFGKKCDHVFKIPLIDLDPEALKDYDLSVEDYFPEATSLAEFIYEAKKGEYKIICQCDYGQSRSAACAAAILQHFEKRGIDIFADYRYYPNQLVYHKVFDALEQYKKSQNAEG